MIYIKKDRIRHKYTNIPIHFYEFINSPNLQKETSQQLPKNTPFTIDPTLKTPETLTILNNIFPIKNKKKHTHTPLILGVIIINLCTLPFTLSQTPKPTLSTAQINLNKIKTKNWNTDISKHIKNTLYSNVQLKKLTLSNNQITIENALGIKTIPL